MDKELMQAARDVLKNAYCKYSNFPVAAAVRMQDGTIITGVNVENASYGLANCAERTALFTAYTQGYRKEDIKELALTTAQDYLVTPCGACRQVLRELVPGDVTITMFTAKDEITQIKNKELLPLAFTEDDL